MGYFVDMATVPKLSDYLVRQDGPDLYTISKWTGGVSPESEYKISKWGGSLHCDCPASQRRHECKHPDIVKAWIKMGKPEGRIIEAQIALASGGSTRRALQSRLVLQKIDEYLGSATEYRPVIEWRDRQDRSVRVQHKNIGGQPAFKFIIGSEQAETILEHKTVIDKELKDAAHSMLSKLGEL
jgi:hypothetical protein